MLSKGLVVWLCWPCCELSPQGQGYSHCPEISDSCSQGQSQQALLSRCSRSSLSNADPSQVLLRFEWSVNTAAGLLRGLALQVLHVVQGGRLCAFDRHASSGQACTRLDARTVGRSCPARPQCGLDQVSGAALTCSAVPLPSLYGDRTHALLGLVQAPDLHMRLSKHGSLT